MTASYPTRRTARRVTRWRADRAHKALVCDARMCTRCVCEARLVRDGERRRIVRRRWEA